MAEQPPLAEVPQSDVMEWHPAKILERANHDIQYALVILNQPTKNLYVLELVWMKAGYRVAADGAANRLQASFEDPYLAGLVDKIELEAICGDLDSIEPEVREYFEERGTEIIEDPDQYSTDFTKCVKHLRDEIFPSAVGPTPDIVCLGGLGGRVDQGMSQLHHLLMLQNDGYAAGRIYLLTTEAITFVLKAGKHRIRVREKGPASVLGRNIGILPLKGPVRITTKGLEWDVSDWLTQFGGQLSTSNYVKEPVVEIFTTDDVLFTIDLNLPSVHAGGLKAPHSPSTIKS